MELQGTHLIANEAVAAGAQTLTAFDPQTSSALEPLFFEATEAEVNRAMQGAAKAAVALRQASSDQIVGFLLAIADEIMALGDQLLERAMQESGLDRARLQGERGRTVNQLKMFADLVTEGSWVDARIETALPDRQPLPRPDLRRMLQPIGPVVVFGASNFPLAFSVAGGDTASAFAARNSVVVKGHPAHPGTSELVAGAIARAVKSQGLPAGTFSLLQSSKPEVSLALVRHPETRAVGFTGSLRAGRALLDESAKRPAPIPVYAEMGSVNPVFLLPGALKAKGDAIVESLFKSATAGVGQFCTCPGIVFAVDSRETDQFREKLAAAFQTAPSGTMLNANVSKGYHEKAEEFVKVPGVNTVRSQANGKPGSVSAEPLLFTTDFQTWLSNKSLHEEIFGPATILVHVKSEEELNTAAQALDGSLTATIHATSEDMNTSRGLADVLSRMAGRVIMNGFPTGVEVGTAMNHGGPYPASTDERTTSVGTAAILRFVRPVCYQNFPSDLLPVELLNANPRGIWRLVNGTLTRDAIQP